MKVIAALLLTAGTILASDFTDKLEKQVLTLKGENLETLKADFSNKKIFVVYYSHHACTSCVKWTKLLNDWYTKEAPKLKNTQMIFATRGDENRKVLTKYIKKSKNCNRHPIVFTIGLYQVLRHLFR